MDGKTLRTIFNDQEIQDLLAQADEALNGITEGPWKTRSRAGLQSFVEAPEPEDRKFGYNIEILGEDDNGYPTRENDVAFVAAARQLVPELAAALRQLINKQNNPSP
jgi:hypothetical protein